MGTGPIEDRVEVRAGRDPSKGTFILLIAVAGLYALSLISVSLLGRNWMGFRALYVPWALSFVALMVLVLRPPIRDRIMALEPWKLMLLVFLVSILTHLPFLLQEPTMSQDILRMERRGEFLMDGKFPYRDFDVNKPPLYIWLVGLLSLPFGPDPLVFRTVFILMDAAIPVLLLLISSHLKDMERGDEGASVFKMGLPAFGLSGAAIAYSLCPVPILEVGLAGHFDPSVALCTLLAFYCLVRGRPLTSGIFLGAGLALKLYPLFMLPVFFLYFPPWKKRWMFLAGFALVPILSSIPVLAVDPMLVVEYFEYQFVDWYTGLSIRYILEYALGWMGLPEGIVYWSLMLVLCAGGGYLFLRGMLGRLRRMDLFVVLVPVLLLGVIGIVYSMLVLLVSDMTFSHALLGLVGVAFPIVLFCLGGGSMLVKGKGNGRGASGHSMRSLLRQSIDLPDVAIISSAVILLLIVTSAQFHPWYLVWLLPFSFSSRWGFWGWSVLFLSMMLQVNAYPPWELSGI